jgi:hypothetical protein
MIQSIEHSTRSRVMSVDCWFFVKSLVIAFIMVVVVAVMVGAVVPVSVAW